MRRTTKRGERNAAGDPARGASAQGMASGLARARPRKPLKTFYARTLNEWRNWLAKHHCSDSEVWLVFYKLHTGRPSVAYEDAVNEALCFGWIDSLIKRLDDARYARKFTPRKLDSNWSPSNRKRYARLRADGRLTAAGRKLAPLRRSGGQAPPVDRVPDYLRRALKLRPAAHDFFFGLAPSYRRLYVRWIDSAKRPETKRRRLQQALERLTARHKPGL